MTPIAAAARPMTLIRPPVTSLLSMALPDDWAAEVAAEVAEAEPEAVLLPPLAALVTLLVAVALPAELLTAPLAPDLARLVHGNRSKRR